MERGCRHDYGEQKLYREVEGVHSTAAAVLVRTISLMKHMVAGSHWAC